jgi:GGDEF domain-containing protein
MIRRFIGRLFGFDAEIARLERKVKDLGWDDCFGIYTRPAFLELCRMQPRISRVVAFLDFDRIHEMNHKVGYDEVNRRVREVFSGALRKSDLVGRHFSGDEIVIVLDTLDLGSAEEVLKGLRARAQEHGLSFTHALGLWEKDEPLEEPIGRLGEEVLNKKKARDRAA